MSHAMRGHQDGRVIVESSGRRRPTEGGKGEPL